LAGAPQRTLEQITVHQAIDRDRKIYLWNRITTYLGIDGHPPFLTAIF
jgi:hypothetical protein